MSDEQLILKSVGSYIETSGTVGPLKSDGKPDLDEGVRTPLEDADLDWWKGLDGDDFGTAEWISRSVMTEPARRKIFEELS